MCVANLYQFSNLSIPSLESDSSNLNIFPTIIVYVYRYVSHFKFHGIIPFK